MNKKTEELDNKYGIRYCKCGERLVPRKVWFKDLILYTCPRSNIFNNKFHSISRAWFANVPALKMGMIGNNLK